VNFTEYHFRPFFMPQSMQLYFFAQTKNDFFCIGEQ
jgi:hypothetical protein